MGLNKFEFKWTGFFEIGRGLEITLVREGDKKYFEYFVNMEKSRVELTREIEFINNLEYINVHKWKENYTPEDVMILDGDEWELKLEYDGNKIFSCGHCYYAPKFRDLLRIFHDIWDMHYAGIEEIDIDEAWEIAKGFNPNYDKVKELEDGWHFFLDDGVERTGGDTGIVVLKIGTWKFPNEYYLGDNAVPL